MAIQHNLDQLAELLATPKRIVITAHANPDGDALGSSLGLYHYLKQKGHRLTIIMPTEMPTFLNWMKDFDQILVYENTRSFSKQIVKEADIIFSLDYNSLSRIEQMQSIVRDSKAYKAMIDHHLEPKDFCQAMFSDTTASSTCELVYRFIDLLGDLEALNTDILNALYVGILTDTGGLRYATSPRLFRIVADMLERGVDNNKLTDLVFNAYTVKRFNLLGFCISERLEYLEGCNTGIIALSQADHKNYNIRRGDLEGVVNFILKIRKIRCAVLIAERHDIVKMSMRSKGDFSVQEVCSTYFNGGGHKNASGGAVKKPFQEVIEQFRTVIREHYKEELTREVVIEL
ncbi:MAG: DHH family phosphoesterase [Aureispira sp.]